MMKWKFPTISPDRVESDPTQGEFFNNNEVDRNESLIREVCQNSLDASLDGRAIVSFSLNMTTLSQSEISPYLSTLIPHLQAIGLEDPIESGPANFLTIEDFGTKGLTGDLNSKDEGNFALFWRRYGKSEKGGSSGGRWGLGKTVYPNSSKASCFFGLTVRSDDNKTCLLGQAMLGSHEISGIRHDPYGTYSISEPGQLQMPSESPEDIALFKKTFGIKRTSTETGLSIVVPFPHEDLDENKLRKAAILHYFFPIIEGTLTVIVNGVKIDAESIKAVSNEVGLMANMKNIFEFAEAVKPLVQNAEFEVKNKNIQNNGTLSEADFDAQTLESIRQKFDEGSIVSVKIPITINSKSAGSMESYIELFIKHDPELEKGLDFYIRNGIAISGQKLFGKKLAMGIMLARSKPVCAFLGDAENPAHTQWTESRIDKKYIQPRITLRFIKRVLNDLLSILSKTPEKTDSKAFQNIFFVEKENTGPGPDNRPTPPVPPISPKSHPYKVSRTATGFAIKANPLHPILPENTTIRVAYAIRKGNPFKKYNPLDFKLEESPIVISGINASEIACDANSIFISGPESDFALEVEGFDPNRDIEIDIFNEENTAGEEL